MTYLPHGILLALLGAVTAATAQQDANDHSTDSLYSKPGELVLGYGARLSLYCTGRGSPTVVFDSGFLDWAPSWSMVQPQITKFTRACSFDRAGTGFSQAGPMPRTSVRIAEELHSALIAAGIPGPYILVGHAFGGDNVRAFADLHMDAVSGLVLVDADATDLEPKWMQELDRRGRGELVAQLRQCGKAIAQHEALPVVGSAEARKTCAQQLFFRGFPEEKWSPELNAKLLDLAQTKSDMYDAFASEMEQMARDELYLQQHRRSLGARPIRVLTSGNHGVPAGATDRAKYEQEITRAQARWLTLSTNSKQIFAHSNSEYIQFDDPQVVIDAIREAYDQTEKSSTDRQTR
jgi:pimeloyl-ACP methyl ester carboxylesterase